MKKHVTVFLLVLGILALLAACKTESVPDAVSSFPDSDDPAKLPEEIYARSKGIFFAVSGGKNIHYLLGSIHVGMEGMYPLAGEIYDAFEKADVLVLELDISDLTLEQSLDMLPLMMCQEGTLMSDTVPRALFDQAAEIIQSEMGIPPFILNNFKPWAAAMLLEEIACERAGLSTEYGVEFHFLDIVGERAIIQLETLEEQIVPFNLLSEESQVLYLEMALQRLDMAEIEANMLINIWRTGDVEALAAIRKESLLTAPTKSYKDFFEALTDVRDARMADRIEELLLCGSGNTYFIIVGALHLAGDNSIVDLLKQKGYSVEIIR